MSSKQKHAGARRDFSFVESSLQEYKDVTTRVLLELLPTREPRRYLYDLVPSYPKRAGKGLRPGLCISTCRAFGGRADTVLKSAVAIELFHNAFLVHDDIEDGSEFRRGLPTLHAEQGVGIAVNVGDAMNVLAIRPLMDNLFHLGPSLTWTIFAEIEHMVSQSVEGQAIELGWMRDNVCELSQDDYLRMTLKKTCWYTCIHPIRIGALVATEGAIDADRFNTFGFYMGAAFQIQDDVLNLVGDRRKYGKEIGGDIWEGKRTLMVIRALNSCNEAERSRLARFLAAPRNQRLAKDVQWVYRLLGKYDCIAFAKESATHLAEAAMKEFSVAFSGAAECDDKRLIEEIITYMIERDL